MLTRFFNKLIRGVRYLMHVQQLNYNESNNSGHSNYQWLSSKPCTSPRMNSNQEFLICHYTKKITLEQEILVMKKLLSWMEMHHQIHHSRVPELAVELLKDIHLSDLVNAAIIEKTDNNGFRKYFRTQVIFMNNFLQKTFDSRQIRSNFESKCSVFVIESLENE